MSDDGGAFSNGFEFDEWRGNWCDRCVKDESGEGPEGTMCPILDVVLLTDEMPEQFSPGTDDLRDRYHCAEFEAP